METKLREMMKRHDDEIQALIKRCPHPPHKVGVREDHSCVGRGSSTPAIVVTCKLCGKERGYHGLDPAWASNHKTALKSFRAADIPSEAKLRDSLGGFKHWDGVTKYTYDCCEE